MQAAYTIQAPPPLPQPDTVEDKRRFALAYLKTNDAMKAANTVEPRNMGRALRISSEWLADPIVQDEIERQLAENGEAAFLESKAEILKDIRLRSRSVGTDHEMFIRYIELYAKIAGFVEKPGSVPLQVNVQSVMVVRSQGSDDDWEASAARGQRRLIDANND